MDLYSKYWGWCLPISDCVWRFLQLSSPHLSSGKFWNPSSPVNKFFFPSCLFPVWCPIFLWWCMPSSFLSLVVRRHPLLCPSLHSFPSVKLKLCNWHTFPSPLPLWPHPLLWIKDFHWLDPDPSNFNGTVHIWPRFFLFFKKCCFSHSDWMC